LTDSRETGVSGASAFTIAIDGHGHPAQPALLGIGSEDLRLRAQALRHGLPVWRCIRHGIVHAQGVGPIIQALPEALEHSCVLPWLIIAVILSPISREPAPTDSRQLRS